MSKRNNDSPYPKDWTNKKLKQEFLSCDCMVNQVECYGRSDLELLTAVEREIEERGGEIITKKVVSFNN